MRWLCVAAASLVACNGGSNGGNNSPTPPPTSVGSVQGTVATEANAGIPNVTVVLSRTGQQSRNATTAATGQYVLSGVPTGSWTLTASLPQGFEAVGSLTASVQVNANQTTQVPVIRMRPGTPPPPQETVVVNMGDNFFQPTPVTISTGQTVRWVNGGAQAHNSTGGSWASPTLNPGGTFEHTFPTAGSFDYVCTLHPGMAGRVIVQ